MTTYGVFLSNSKLIFQGYESVQTEYGSVESGNSTRTIESAQKSEYEKIDHGGVGTKYGEIGSGNNKESIENSRNLELGYGGSGYGNINAGYGGPAHQTDTNKKTETLPGKQVCIPNKIFKDKCNICRCSVDGTTASCSKEQCLDQAQQGIKNCFVLELFFCTEKIFLFLETTDKVTTTAENIETTTKKQICFPNAIFKNNCDDCKCSPDGVVAVCTRKSCPEKQGTVSHFNNLLLRQKLK